MKKKVMLILIMIMGTSIFFYACNKSEQSESNNEESIIFQSNVDSKEVDSKTVFLGGNTKKITKIKYSNSFLKSLVHSNEWSKITKQLMINTNDIKKTYLHNSEIILVTFPIKNEIGSYFNVYFYKNKFVITKINEKFNENGYRTYSITSVNNELYYKFDLNNQNQIGNWHFNNTISFDKFKTENKYNSTQIESADNTPCASRPFNACMTCFIVGVCGSDWVCTVACGAFIISCVGGAAAACILIPA